MKCSTWLSIASILGIPLLSLSCGSTAATTATTPMDDGGSQEASSPVCGQLTTYTASSMKALSFATDILPILMQDSSGAGCGLAVACHGNPPVYLDSAMTHAESFVGTPATVKAVLLGSSVNAPSMKLVAPGSVGTSFLAYKLSGKPGLTCIQSACKAHNSIGTITTCGDPMPYVGLGMLADADRTKILDWIAQGAKD